MTPTADSIRLQRLARKAIREEGQLFGVSAVALFGSSAWGNARPWSDVDMCLIGSDERVLTQAAHRIEDRFHKSNVDATAMTMTFDQFKEAARHHGSVSEQICRDGIVLTGRLPFIDERELGVEQPTQREIRNHPRHRCPGEASSIAFCREKFDPLMACQSASVD